MSPDLRGCFMYLTSCFLSNYVFKLLGGLVTYKTAANYSANASTSSTTPR